MFLPPSGEKRAEKKKLPGSLSFSLPHQLALVTLPERRQRVQAYTWQGLPSTTAFTRFTLGFQVRLERRWEWDTLIPKTMPLPQKSHFAIFLHLLYIGKRSNFAPACLTNNDHCNRYREKMQAFFSEKGAFGKNLPEAAPDREKVSLVSKENPACRKRVRMFPD